MYTKWYGRTTWIYIGNALEVKETINFFNNKYDKRLYDLSIYISSLMISTAKNIPFSTAKKLAINLVQNGYAKSKFYSWIKYQGGNINKLKDKARTLKVYSNKTGYINRIDSHKLSKLVFDLGAGRVKKKDTIDYACGVVLSKTIGSRVHDGELLGTIYYNKKVNNMDELLIDCFQIDKKKKKVKKIILKTVK